MELLQKLKNTTLQLQETEDKKHLLFQEQADFFEKGLEYILHDGNIIFYWKLTNRDFITNKMRLIDFFVEFLKAITKKTFIIKDIKLLTDKKMVFLNEYRKEDVIDETNS